jgi:hypothetical protein
MGVCEASAVLPVVSASVTPSGIVLTAQFPTTQSLDAYCPQEYAGATCQLVVAALAASPSLTNSSALVMCEVVAGQAACVMTLPRPQPGGYVIALQPVQASLTLCDQNVTLLTVTTEVGGPRTLHVSWPIISARCTFSTLLSVSLETFELYSGVDGVAAYTWPCPLCSHHRANVF